MDEDTLLKKLREENELLEGDVRCHTKIVSRSGSSASMKSANSANSSSNSQRGSMIEVEGHQKATPTTTAELRPAEPLPEAEMDQTTPPSSPETPVKSKPAAPYFSQDSSESSQGSGYSGEEGEELGPEASIILDDGLGTRIELGTVLPSDGGVADGSGLEEEEEEELEIPNEIAVGDSDTKPVNFELSRTTTLSPAEPCNSEQLPSEKVKEESEEGTNSSHNEDPDKSHDQEDGSHDQEDEERDVLSELKRGGPPEVKVEQKGSGSSGSSSGSGGGTMKRARSETEAGGRKVSLASLVGRVRSQTILDPTLKDKHLTKGEDEGSEVKLSPEEELWSQWSQLLKNWEESAKRQAKLIKLLARRGIPEHLRGMAWQLLSNSQNQELKEYYPSLITEVSPHERAIQRDLARTFPEHSFFKERDGLGQESLLNVLKAYSVFDREVGYCQGSPFISGLLLMQMPEEDAFCVFVSLMKDYRLRELYKPSMADLGLCFHLLEKCLEELFPNLYLHFRAVGFQTSMYASPWFLTMFASVLSLNVVFRIMDIYFVEGREIVFRVGLALLEHSHDKLIQLDMEDMLKHFQKEMRVIHEADPDGLINRALRIRYNTKKMKKIEKEFIYRKEKQAQDNAAMAKLRAENYELGQRLLVLEKECASLADQLIQGQVKRAEEAEEMIEMKKQLSLMKRKVSEMDTPAPTTPADHTPLPLVDEEAPPTAGTNTDTNDVAEREETPEQSNIDNVEVTKPSSPEVFTDSSAKPSPVPEVLTDSPKPSPSPVPVRKKERTESKSSLTSEVSLEPSDEKLHKKKKKHKKFKPKLKDKDKDKSKEKESSSLPNSPCGERKGERGFGGMDIDLAKELARAKTHWADVSSQLEEKDMELKQALEREAFVVRELRASRDYVTALEHKLSQVQLERQSCPHCSKGVEPATEEGAMIGSGEELQPLDVSASKAILSQLQAMRTQEGDSPPTTNGRVDRNSSTPNQRN